MPRAELIVDLAGLLLEGPGGLVDLPRQVGGPAGALLVFGLQAVVQGLDFPAEERLDRREPLADLLPEVAGFPGQLRLELGELPIGVAHLHAEQEVADLFEAGDAVGFGRVAGRACVLRIEGGCHGSSP